MPFTAAAQPERQWLLWQWHAMIHKQRLYKDGQMTAELASPFAAVSNFENERATS